MPEIWQMTLSEFVGDWKVEDPVNSAAALADDMHLASAIREGTEDWMMSTLRRVPASPGYFIAEVAHTDGDVALLFLDEDTGEYDVCGGYCDNELWIEHGPSRGRKLSPELVIAKASIMGRALEPYSYTTAGRAAHVSGHRIAVERAVRAGYRVPEDVLADYPALQSGARRIREVRSSIGQVLTPPPVEDVSAPHMR